MNIYLLKNEQYAGPYSEPEVMSRIKAGSYAKTDLAWCEGCTGPVPLIEILCRPSATRPMPTAKAFSAKELTIIAQNYNRLLVTAVSWFLARFLPWPDLIQHLMFLTILGLWILFGWRLARALHERPWVWVIWSLLPFGNFYALIRILCTAARTLKSNGVPVGIFGPDRTALARLAESQG
jgi:hypothetical protein